MTWKEKRDGREGNDEGTETQAKRRRVVVEEGEEGDSRGEAALPDVEGVHRGRPGGAEAWAYAEAVRVDRGDQHEAQEAPTWELGRSELLVALSGGVQQN